MQANNSVLFKSGDAIIEIHYGYDPNTGEYEIVSLYLFEGNPVEGLELGRSKQRVGNFNKGEKDMTAQEAVPAETEEKKEKKPVFTLRIVCKDEEEQQALFTELNARGVKVKV